MKGKTPPFDNKHILCGRGQQKYNCSGNKVLRQLVAIHLHQYMTKASLRTAKTKIVDTVTTRLFDMGMVFISMKGGGSHDWTTLNYADARKKVAHRFRDAARQQNSGNQDDLVPSPDRSTSASPRFDPQDSTASVVSFTVDTTGGRDTQTLSPPKTTATASSFDRCSLSPHQHQETKEVRSKVLVDTMRGYVIDAVSSQSTIGAPRGTNSMSLDQILSHSNGLGTLVSSHSSNLLLRRNLWHHQLHGLVTNPASREGIGDNEETLNQLEYQQVLEFEGEDDISLSGVDSLEDLDMVFRDIGHGDFWDVDTSVCLLAGR